MENLIGKVIKKTIKLKIEILDIQKDIPESEIDNFLLWLESIAVELGLGKHHEYYSYTDNYKEDIPVSFKVDYDF